MQRIHPGEARDHQDDHDDDDDDDDTRPLALLLKFALAEVREVHSKHQAGMQNLGICRHLP